MLALVLSAAPVRAQNVVPLPREFSANGASYVMPRDVTIIASPPVRELEGVARRILREHGAGAALTLSTNAHDFALGNEGYRLSVAPDGITISSNGFAGAFYGLQTLDQLVPYGGAASMDAVEIRDWPAFRWRGIHLDVSRHFFAVSVVERYIDLAAHYKLNVFHWHLTDDQGWRIQILRYPRLASAGGCRAGSEMDGDATEIDGKPACGFYTQSQIRAVVAYARDRNVTIVPEIEMPGHSQAALAAYPELACAPGPFSVRETWGVSDEIYCPTEYTFTFLQNVLLEVIALFPGKYVHIGGDEVPKTAWERSPAVQAFMRRNGIATYDGVEGYFDRRIERFLRAHGRSVVGWDDVLDGGVSDSATIMSWQGEPRAIKAAKRGNDVVMTPNGPLYFDAYQGDPNDEPQAIGNLATPQDVYEYEPIPTALTPGQTRHIIGVQGNLWTEYIDTPDYLFYMLLPRMLSLSEIAWSDPRPRIWSAFSARMGTQFPWLARHRYNFRIPNPEFGLTGVELRFANVSPSVRTVKVEVEASETNVVIATIVPDGVIHYTIDGTAPTPASPIYGSPIAVVLAPNQRADIRAVVTMPPLRSSTVSELVLTRVTNPR